MPDAASERRIAGYVNAMRKLERAEVEAVRVVARVTAWQRDLRSREARLSAEERAAVRRRLDD